MWAAPPRNRANRANTMVVMKRSWAIFRDLATSDKLPATSPAWASSTAAGEVVMAAPAIARMKMTTMKN